MPHRVFSQEFSFGDYLKESFALLTRNIIPLLVMNIIFIIPTIFNNITNEISEFSIAMNPRLFFSTLIVSLISFIGNIATLKILHNDLFEEKSSYSELFSFSLKRYFPYLVGMLVYALFILVGSLLLIIPGFIVAIMLIYTVYIVVLRQYNNPVDAMQYSRKLVKGRFGRTFGYILSMGIMIIVIYLIFEMILTIALSGGEINLANIVSLGQGQSPISIIISNIMLILVSCFSSAFILLMMINYEAEKGYFVEEGKE